MSNHACIAIRLFVAIGCLEREDSTPSLRATHSLGAQVQELNKTHHLQTRSPPIGVNSRF